MGFRFGLGFMGYRFGIGLFGIQVWDWVIWNIGLGFGYLGYMFWDWVIWDIINIAWLINPDWVPTFVTTSPVLSDELLWEKSDHRHLMREAFDVRRDEIFIDFYEKLNKL